MILIDSPAWIEFQRATGSAAVLPWWPVGSHLHELLGTRYAATAAALGPSTAHGIGQLEPTSIEGHVVAAPGPAQFIPPAAATACRPPSSPPSNRARPAARPRRTSLSPRRAYFDWLVVLGSSS